MRLCLRVDQFIGARRPQVKASRPKIMSSLGRRGHANCMHALEVAIDYGSSR